MGAHPEIRCLGMEEELAADVGPILVEACSHLQLAEHFRLVAVCADELPGEDNVWYGLARAGTPSRSAAVTVYCDPAAFIQAGTNVKGVYPPTAVWEQSAAPQSKKKSSRQVFSRVRTERVLHHHLLMVRDLVRGDLIPETVPHSLVQAFEAAWAVGVDGRLARSGWPGFPLADRRGLFSRLFAPAGILLPDHWQIFQSIWDGALTGQRDILMVVRQLPRL